MRSAILLTTLAIALAGCATANQTAAPAVPRQVRELSDAEKAALARSLPMSFKDPDSAKFRWMPVTFVPGSPQTDYCGLVNGKNSYGAYVGYREFHAVIQADAKGQYVGGSIDGTKTNLDMGTKSWSDAWNDGTVEGLCQRNGYVDFSQAR